VSHAPPYRLGVDIGGTFTDIVLLASDGRCVTRKVLSTPDDYARGIMQGLGELLAAAASNDSAPQYGATGCEEIIHGTTVATNAILEKKGAKTGLLTTRGFRDVLELRRLRVPSLYDLRFRPPTPMVERRLRLEINERMSADGEPLTPLDEQSILQAIDRLRAEGVQSVAVTLLHSYCNPRHETRVGEIIRREMPEAFVSLSTEVLPEIREYERTSTTVINAYVGPLVRFYLESLSQKLKSLGIRAPLRIMRSSGGKMSMRAAMARPATMVESGPAAGTIAAAWAGEALGTQDLIAFDMGGTTAKATLVEGGKVTLTTEYEVGAGISLSSRLIKGGGHALKLPVLDIAEVGAGGGSLVWIDKGGSLKVGPQSAGASPGPACYGLGGTQATVTDANLVLGYLNPSQLAGGALQLYPDRARAALEDVAIALGARNSGNAMRERTLGRASTHELDPGKGPLDGGGAESEAIAAAAHGVHTVANVSMIRAIKAVSTYRGRDPRDFALLAFGGSGPLHAVNIARELGISRVLIPPMPGLFSAVGLLQAPTEENVVQTFVRNSTEIDPDELSGQYRVLEERARTALMTDGYGAAEIQLQQFADLRYVGQAYELTVPAQDRSEHESRTPAFRLATKQLTDRFEAEHERVYGHRARNEPIELVNLRVVATVEDVRGRHLSPEKRSIESSERLAYFGDGWLETPVIGREALGSKAVEGPLIIEDYDSTTIVPPGCSARLCNLGAIAIDVSPA
jgi:N-methylhydantoinase A